MKAIDISIKKSLLITVYDIAALCFVYFIPVLSHLFSFPLYMMEPMRIVIILALIHTNRKNAYILALTLPVFSTLAGGHPDVFKMLIMSVELFLNVWLFAILTEKIQNKFLPLFLSIVFSKMVYYGLKFLLIYFLFLNSELITTPLYIQLIISIIISVYSYLILDNKLKVERDLNI